MKKCFLFVFSFLLIHFSLSAQSWLWGRGGSTASWGSDLYSIAMDKQGNAYIAGWYFSPSMSFGSYTLPSLNIDGYLVKYDSLGNVLWATQSKVSASNYSSMTNAVATDNFGDIYITGTYDIDKYGYVAFGPFHLTSQSSQSFLIKYNSSGKVIWAKQTSTPNFHCNSQALSLATDKLGNIYITGQYYDTIQFGSHVLTSNPAHPWNLFLVKYDSAGNAIWARKATLSSNSQGVTPNYVYIDKTANVYVTGYFQDTLTFGSYVCINPFSGNLCNMFFAKYDSSGNIKWVKQTSLASSASHCVPHTITSDNANSIYLTGSFNDTVSFNPYTLRGSSSVSPLYGDIFLIKYDTNGNVKWAKQSTNSATSNSYGWSGYCLNSDSMNNIYMTAGGFFLSGYGDVVFANDTFNYNANTIYRDPGIIMKMDTSGNILCSSYLPYTGGDDNIGIVSNPNGSLVYIAGDNWNTINFNKDTFYVSIPYYSEYPFIARWLPCGADTARPHEPPLLPCASLFVPTAFSPNKDGQNDILCVRGNCINTMDFVVFDRWGNKVFESENQGTGWDGTYKGEPENTGAYVYYLKATLNDGTVVDKKGSVTLVR